MDIFSLIFGGSIGGLFPNADQGVLFAALIAAIAICALVKQFVNYHFIFAVVGTILGSIAIYNYTPEIAKLVAALPPGISVLVIIAGLIRSWAKQ